MTVSEHDFAERFAAAKAEAAAVLQQHGREVGGRLLAARAYTGWRTRPKEPPNGWDWVQKMNDRVAGGPGSSLVEYSDEERRQLASYWAWYLPLEASVVRLVELLEFFGRRPRYEQHREVAEELFRVADDVRDFYAIRCQSQSLAWTPLRLKYKGKPYHLVDFLRRAIADFPEDPERAPEQPEEPESLAAIQRELSALRYTDERPVEMPF